MYFLLFRIFEQLALALKNRVGLEFFKPGWSASPPPRTPMVEITTNEWRVCYYGTNDCM